MNIVCTYCWTIHNVRSLDWWLENKQPNVTCGNDRRRYFFNHEDYIAYVRRYEANGNSHQAAVGDAVQLEMELSE